MEINLDNEQQKAYNKYINKENIFITGPGGTGKTYLIKHIAEHAKKNKKQIKICALTGCAAILLECGATTLHRFAGIGLATGSIESVVNKVLKNIRRRINWNIDILIVDEVSMLSLKLLKILDRIARKIRKQPNIPFGGIQIIFSGDFYQLPPIGDNDDEESKKFCFESPLWNKIFSQDNHIILKKIYRQNDPKYIKILNNIRIGKITKSMIKTLEERVIENKENNENNKNNEVIRPTILLPRRRAVDQINQQELEKLEEKEFIYMSQKVPESDLLLSNEEKINFEIITEREKVSEAEFLMENIIAEKEIILKKGSLVMCIANLDLEGEFPIVNGSQGIIIDFVNHYPLVKFNNGCIKLITPHIWRSERLSCIAISQLPLIHAWAITIHKAQGLSIEKGIINIGDNVFECGQTYVALSRIRSLEGLSLTGFDFTKIKINKKVYNFYSQFN